MSNEELLKKLYEILAIQKGGSGLESFEVTKEVKNGCNNDDAREPGGLAG